MQGKAQAIDVARMQRVSATELSRRMSAFLDEIDSENTSFLVVRYGRPAAVILPFTGEGRLRRPDRGSDSRARATIDAAEVSEALDQLDNLQRRMLVDLVRDRASWRSGNYTRDGAVLARALGGMGLWGLTEKIGVGTFPTPLGIKVAEEITARAEHQPGVGASVTLR